MGRPRKYGSDAERLAAYRQRWARLEADIEPQTVATVRKIAEQNDRSVSEVVSQLIKFALTNHNWLTEAGVTWPAKSLQKASGNVKRNPDEWGE